MKLVHGFGINDIEKAGPACYVLEGKKVSYPDYEMWKAMLCRSKSDKEKIRRPYCPEADCHIEWKFRSNFQSWYFNHNYFLDAKGGKLQLDKDLKYKGNKIYGPDSCFLLPKYINTTIREGSGAEIPWTRFIEGRSLKKPWRSSVYYDGCHHELGVFFTSQEAHIAAQYKKADLMEDMLYEKYLTEIYYQEDIHEAIEVRIKALRTIASMGIQGTF